MKKYKRKPIEVEAIQFYVEKDKNKAFQFTQKMFMSWPIEYDKKDNPFITIDIPEGKLICRQGDWIIRDIAGDLSVCRDDIFLNRFEKVGK